VADEIAQHVRRFFGAPRIGCVVAVSCGHSRRDDCLSVQIAQMVASILAVAYVAAFECAPLPGSSHPRSQHFRTPKLVVAPTGDTVLLVDDVATSGRHIEAAVEVLRGKVSHVMAIAWLGAN
jgi:predicted phosphoribosyltransferase